MEKFEIEQLNCIDTDQTLSADSDRKIPTQKAVKKFVESYRVQYLINLSGDSGTLTQEQIDIVSNNSKLYLIINDGQIFNLVNTMSNLTYKTFINLDIALSSSISAKAIYIQLDSSAANYGRWTKEDIVVMDSYTKSESDSRYATAAQGSKADTAVQPDGLNGAISTHNSDSSAHSSLFSSKANTNDLSDLAFKTNVDLTGATTGKVLTYNGTKWVPSSGGGGATWGGITGTLSNQTDLNDALNSKSGVVLSVW